MSQLKNIIHAIKSLTAAMFGVQSSNAARRDCASNNPLIYIIIATVLLICFVIAVIMLAKLVLS